MVCKTDGYGDSSGWSDSIGDTEGTTPVHASEASASVLVLERLLLSCGRVILGVEMEDGKFIRRVFQS